MPTTLFTFPRELRDEVYTYVALTSDFTFLLACRQFNDEGTPFLYKHGIYRLRALKHRKERVPAPPTPSQAAVSKIQNLYISMPHIPFGDHKSPNYEIPLRTVIQLGQFAGTDIRRGFCHLDLQGWTLSQRMAEALGGFRGFDVVRVEVRLKPYYVENDGRIRPHDFEQQDEERDECVQLIETRLGTALGPAKWENKDSGTCFEKVLVAEFRPRLARK